MEIWAVVILGIICIIAGYLLGAWHQKVSEKYAGLLVIDPINPEVHGGVYTVFDEKPHEMVEKGLWKDGDIIELELAITDIYRRSQQNQG